MLVDGLIKPYEALGLSLCAEKDLKLQSFTLSKHGQIW